MGDALFSTIERWHGGLPWGDVLDAGTGAHSLSWLLGLPTRSITAVTGGSARERELTVRFGARLRGSDRVLTGNWKDPGLLRDERFDVVLADYLLGAIDGWAPYFQDQLLPRLRPTVGGRLYFVGLSPYDDEPDDEASVYVRKVAALRDACILLASHRTYREYPQDWVVRHLEQAGFTVLEQQHFPIVYRDRFVDGQLDVCVRKLPHLAPALRPAMRDHIERVRDEGHALVQRLGGLHVGSDYVIAAERKSGAGIGEGT